MWRWHCFNFAKNASNSQVITQTFIRAWRIFWINHKGWGRRRRHHGSTGDQQQQHEKRHHCTGISYSIWIGQGLTRDWPTINSFMYLLITDDDARNCYNKPTWKSGFKIIQCLNKMGHKGKSSGYLLTYFFTSLFLSRAQKQPAARARSIFNINSIQSYSQRVENRSSVRMYKM